MQLSKHFTEKELACKHCGLLHIEPRLLSALEELRELADAPIYILSGYRCVTHNSKVGGAKNSLHTAGKAVDLTIKGYSLKEMYQLADSVNAFYLGGIGIYPDEKFIHVDVRKGRARWARLKNKYVSLDEGLKVLEKVKA